MIEVWNRLVDTFYKQTSTNKRLCSAEPAPSRDQIEEYLSYYALNGGLFTVSDKDDVLGVMTVHRGKKDFDHNWESSGEVTIHMLWTKSQRALHNLAVQGFCKMKPEKVWYCRDGKLKELTTKKIERVLKYGV